jgi:hypothetical protein
MLSRVRNDVIDATGGKQVPWENSSLTGEIILVPPPSSPPPSLAAEVKSESPKNEPDTELSFWQSAERIGTKAAFEAYKREFGNKGRFAALADERIAALSTSNPSNILLKPADVTKVQNTADEKIRANDSGGTRPVRNPKSQTVKKAPDEQSSSRSVRTTARVAPPARKREVRRVSRATQPEAQAQYRTVPQPEPQVQVQYHAPAPVLTAPFGHRRPKLGIGIGLGGIGIGF